tara:strand:+ start:22 stop:231 length:210 start_codon:yes stop_codon:yes gene_type:complete
MAKKRELNDYRQTKDAVYNAPKSHGKPIYHKAGLEIDLFVEEMVKQYPNYYSLGQAIYRHYLENIENNG